MPNNRWLLPEGIEEVSPGSAWRLEQLRRNLLDLYHSWGYDLVMPPFVEFLEALLTGTGSDLELQTFKLTDPISGRQLGIRADMTPQVARIDARLSSDIAQRLCYMGTVLITRSDGFGGSRSPGAIISGSATWPASQSGPRLTPIDSSGSAMASAAWQVAQLACCANWRPPISRSVHVVADDSLTGRSLHPRLVNSATPNSPAAKKIITTGRRRGSRDGLRSSQGSRASSSLPPRPGWRLTSRMMSARKVSELAVGGKA